MTFIIKGKENGVTKRDLIIHEMLDTLADIGFISDAVIYVLLTKRLRLVLKKKFLSYTGRTVDDERTALFSKHQQTETVSMYNSSFK